MSWRSRLLPASFRGVPFHIDESQIAGGRRIASHDYPKRNSGYSEDMGRRLRSFRVRGYVIGSNYDLQLRALAAVLEADGSSTLVLSTQGIEDVVCVTFSAVETREDGGFATVDMEFQEAGQPVGAIASTDTAADVGTKAGAASEEIQKFNNKDLAG